jgi:hypothetical protein
MTTTQKILNYWITETNFGFCLCGNREISGLIQIAYFDTKKEAEAEMKKLTSKSKKFENVQIGDIVSYQEKGEIKTGVVVNVSDKFFEIEIEGTWVNQYDETIHYKRTKKFYKSGCKINRFHSHFAIEIVGKI